MRSTLSESQRSVAELREAVQAGRLGPQPSTITITGASTIYQTTQFSSSTIKYHNYYLLLRSESYFGACSYMPDQLDSGAAALFSGRPLDEVLEDQRLPVQVAALDAYLGVVYPHQQHGTRAVQIDAGTPIAKAKQRDALIADLAGVQPSQKVALIGVVNPLIEAISQRGGICLPCDLQLVETQWGDPVERGMDKVLEQADNVICTAMTLSNGTFNHILKKVREKRIPLTIYAQTGSAVIARFVGAGVTALLAEPFPFTQFSGDASRLYVYTPQRRERMLMKLKLQTDNLLHTNPSLYVEFNGDHDQSMAQFIHKLLVEFKTGRRVLDIGSGPGREVAYLNRNGYDAVGLDQSQEMLDWSRTHYPELSFVYGDQTNFSLEQQFDALYCVGSTFLYNFTNEAVLSSLHCFRKHLHSGGLLYLDMRNAAFFLTREGQRWLTEDLVEQRKIGDTVVSLKTRFSIDLANQLLERDYCWTVAGQKPVVEHLKHRLLFPQELASYLQASGFRLLQLFDKPSPHVDSFDQGLPLTFSRDMQGTRMQIVAQAV